MNTRTLQLFTVVASLGSITEAATRLRVSQPAVSMQLRRLEDELGVTLLTPFGRGIALTDAGRTFLEHAQTVLAAEEQMLRAMEEYREGRKGHIVLGASSFAGTYLLPGFIANFANMHTGIDLELCICPEHEIEKLVKAGQIDIGITVFPILDHLSFRVMPFCQEWWTVVQSVDEGESSRFYVAKETPADLLSMFAEQQLTISEVDSMELVKQLAIAGMGLGLVMKSAVQMELSHGILHEASHQSFPRQALLSVITRPAERLSKSIWSFLAYANSRKNR